MADDFMTGYLAGKDDNGSNNNGGGLFGSEGILGLIVILALFNGGFGFGGGGGMGGRMMGGGGSCGCGTCATQADLAAGFNNSAVLGKLNDLTLGQAGIQQTMCQGFNGINTGLLQGFAGVGNAVSTLGYNLQGNFNSLSHQMSDCCCETQRMVERGFCDTGYALATNTGNIIQSANANTDRVLAKLDAMETSRMQEKLAAQRDEILSLKFAASQSVQNNYFAANQEAQTARLIRELGNPCPVPAYVVPNPNCCYGNPVGVGYNNGSNHGGCVCPFAA